MIFLIFHLEFMKSLAFVCLICFFGGFFFLGGGETWYLGVFSIFVVRTVPVAHTSANNHTSFKD